MGCTTFTPVNATSNDMGSKVGQSHGGCVFGIINYGAPSIANAARSGGITKISTVDKKETKILGGFIWTGWTTIVTGE